MAQASGLTMRACGHPPFGLDGGGLQPRSEDRGGLPASVQRIVGLHARLLMQQ